MRNRVLSSLILLVIFSLEAVSASTPCSKSQRPQALLVRRLVGEINVNISAESPDTCQLLCIKDQHCQSWNYHFTDNMCQLLNNSRSHGESRLERAPQWIHMDNAEHPCIKKKPCKNGGKCTRSTDAANSTEIQCDCVPGFNGTYCTEECNMCTSDPCLNGLCSPIKGGFECTCNPGFVGKRCEHNASSCEDYFKHDRSLPNGPYYLDSSPEPVYCHMDYSSECGEGGWTLVIKMDGSKSTFGFASELWSNKETYQPTSGQTVLGNGETKLPTYWTLPFNSMCLSMSVNGDQKWLKFNYPHQETLYNIISDNKYHQLTESWSEWEKLISGAYLQNNCKESGFNTLNGRSWASCRIGIVGNNEDDCRTCDSSMGFGCNNYITCGNRCGSVKNTAFGYIFIK